MTIKVSAWMKMMRKERKLIAETETAARGGPFKRPQFIRIKKNNFNGEQI